MKRFVLDIQRFAEGGAGTGGGAGGQGGDGGGAADKGGAGKGDGDPNAGKTFSQEELDAIITKRLAREQKAWEIKVEEERKKANMTEQEKLKVAAEEAEKRGKAAVDLANQRLVAAEAKAQALALGVKPEKIAYLLRLADLSAADVDDKGTVNEKVVKQAIEAVLKDLPELKAGGPGGLNIGGNPAGGGTANGGMNAFIRKAAGR